MPSSKEGIKRASKNSPDRIQVTGEMSRADWEELYFLAQELAQKHGLTVEGFDLKPAKPEDPEGVSKRPVDAQETAADPE